MPTPQIESKNLMILEDQASQEMIATKKMESYAAMLTDTQSKTIATQLASHHRNRFNNLVSYLNSHR